ncbi:MAG: DUF5615 family PIN-like protein [Patescibacteria group bacterium]|nr:DUF5615 family PIN-like protein [Patescibacteria group bacterium]
MKFLIDEDISPKLAGFLHRLGHSAIHIRDIKISLADDQILELSVTQESIVITEDKDFGELVFKNTQSAKGVILLRLEDQTVQNTKRAINWLLSNYSSNRIQNHFVVVTEKSGKIAARTNRLKKLARSIN